MQGTWNREQKACVLAHHLQLSKWNLLRETEFYLVIYNSESKQRLWIDKFIQRKRKQRNNIPE